MVKGSIFTRKRNNKYLAEQLDAVKKYADVISHTSKGDIMTEPGEEYRCYDRVNGFPFILRFEYSGIFGRLEVSEGHTFSRKYMLRIRSACDKLISAGKNGFSGDCFTRYSPDGCSGVMFFLPEKNEAEAETLAKRLHDESGALRSGDDIYLSYTVFICREELYEKLRSTTQDELDRCDGYYSGEKRGQPGIDAAEYLLNCGFELSQDGWDIAVINCEPNSSGFDMIRYKKLRSV